MCHGQTARVQNNARQRKPLRKWVEALIPTENTEGLIRPAQDNMEKPSSDALIQGHDSQTKPVGRWTPTLRHKGNKISERHEQRMPLSVCSHPSEKDFVYTRVELIATLAAMRGDKSDIGQNVAGIISMPKSSLQMKFFAATACSRAEDPALDDEALLVKMEVRLSAESGADAMNAETFGDCTGGWTFEEAAEANAKLVQVGACVPGSLRKEAPSFEMPEVDWAKVVDAVCSELSEIDFAPQSTSHSVAWFADRFQPSAFPKANRDSHVVEASARSKPLMCPHPTFFAGLDASHPNRNQNVVKASARSVPPLRPQSTFFARPAAPHSNRHHNSSTFEIASKLCGSFSRISSSSTEDFTSSPGSSAGD